MITRILRGFTLIEMLLVIAIIMILAGMMYPVLSKARESGRATQCSSNLHQLQLASLNYANDHDGKIPACACNWYQWEDGSWRHTHGWVSWKNYSPQCTDTNAHDNTPNYAWSGADGISCVTNGALYGYVKGGEGIYKCPTFSMKSNCKVDDPKRSYAMNMSASEFNLLAGSGQPNTILFGDDSLLVGNPAADAQFSTNEINRIHNGKANVVYVDGHVDKM